MGKIPFLDAYFTIAKFLEFTEILTFFASINKRGLNPKLELLIFSITLYV